MKKIKNKFIIFISSFAVLILISIFWSLYLSKVDRDTYLVVVSWNALLNDKELNQDDREALKVWDSIKTLWEKSVSVIEWWDWSITRLWWNTYVEISEMYFEDNLSKINVNLELKSWKLWSNVISFFDDDSHFKHTFRDNEAAVRWTVFAIDLDKDYINVISHELELISDTWKRYVIPESKPFIISSFSFVSLDKFIREIKDKSWESMNKNLDKEFILKIKKRLLEDLKKLEKFSLDIEKVNNYSEEKKQKVYNDVIESYQRLNFLESDSSELYNLKLKYKEYLLEASNSNDKEALIRSYIYDFKDSIESKNTEALNYIMPALWRNSSILNSLEINILDYMNFDSIPEWLRKSLSDNIEFLKNIFWEWFDISDFEELKDRAQSTIIEWIEELKDNLNN